MTAEEKTTALKEIRADYLLQMGRIMEYHHVDPEQQYYAEQNVENFFDRVIEFYENEGPNKKTIRKGLMLDMLASISSVRIPMSLNGWFDSPIEYLFHSALRHTYPPHIWEKTFIMTQQEMVGDKYRTDLVLMERLEPVIDGKEGKPLVVLECDGYDAHYSDSTRVSKTLSRSRAIQMLEDLPVFHYSGKEIYNDCTQLANEFWEYVERKYYPKHDSP